MGKGENAALKQCARTEGRRRKRIPLSGRQQQKQTTQNGDTTGPTQSLLTKFFCLFFQKKKKKKKQLVECQLAAETYQDSNIPEVICAYSNRLL